MASKTKSWLWHCRLSHLNFGAINHLARQGLVRGLPKLKFEKDHLCSACAMGKSTKKSHKPKSEDTNQEKLYLLHMDLCGPMLRRIRTDNGTEFVNQTLRDYYEEVGISHETSVARSPQQNGVVERRNWTLIEVARTMLIYAQTSLFLWAEAVATACFTQNRSIIQQARKKKQDINWNLKPREMPSARTHPNACTPKPRSNNQTFRNWLESKSSNVKLNITQKADHSRNPSSCSDSKHLVCLTCQKCIFNANHDACIIKFLKEENSHAKIQSLKSRNSISPVGKKSNVNKPEKQIFKGYRLSPNKSSALHEKTSPRSCLRWKPTGRIFKTVGLRWVPTGKIFTDSTTKVDIKPPNGSNYDIANLYECDQTLNVSASTLNLSACISFNPKKERLRVWLLNRLISHKPGVQGSQM
nr:hypothetical protein [Tanacetum cinerariifolium]